ncbi:MULTISPECIES: hypothetical protein [unclassified Microbacterium]|uniref:hypothetical protein n=1 Tax=unclassified Microbacterium TaxID=2609290 RepID=UPI000EA84A9D|nr:MULTISPECIES: hypothetical protein [unclassified Microbacterium]MBT2484414.1 hypothetical protein [Microbacterium sp. ISL-108]RKN67324.1 hypothetical protein D7252_06860 [Microbacterium sp. CGR2]
MSAARVGTETIADLDKVTDLDELVGIDRGQQICECDHGTEEAYAPCGRKAKWRVSIDCVCGENHPRRVELLCSRCLRTLRMDYDREAITARRL